MLDYLALIIAQDYMRQQIDGTQPIMDDVLPARRGKVHAAGLRTRTAAMFRRLADRLEPVGETG